MSIIGLLLLVAVIGFILWLLQTYVPMHAAFRAVIWFIAIIGLVVLLLNAFGFSTGISTPRLR